MSNALTYSIARECLERAVGNQKFRMHAWAGGRRGSVTPGVAEHDLNSYDVLRREQGNASGGPLPMGWYVCHYQPHQPKLHQIAANNYGIVGQIW